jgi:putative FmdB family regulatory protein
MPLFEYTCNRCGAKFDEWVQSIDREVECPVCKSRRVEKLYSPFSTGAGYCEPSGGGT